MTRDKCYKNPLLNIYTTTTAGSPTTTTGLPTTTKGILSVAKESSETTRRILPTTTKTTRIISATRHIPTTIRKISNGKKSTTGDMSTSSKRTCNKTRKM